MSITTTRAGVDALRFGYGETRIGMALVAESDRGIAAILLGDDRPALRRALATAFVAARLVEDAAGLTRTIAKVTDLVDAPHLGSSLALDLRGSELELAVWAALRAI